MRVSIICPLYNGGKYVNHIVDMAIQNYNAIDEKSKMEIEVILVNDCDEKIAVQEETCQYIMVKRIQNEQNKGIHFSRVRGFREATGDYVLFLDQDDDITSQYVLSQIEKIHDSDAVVCNGINNGHKIYYSEEMIKAACDTEKFLDGKNRIISPGQVLIKREAIPDEWTDNFMRTNGADDYLLWLLMLLSNKKFTYNYEILYRHNSTGSNTSNDIRMMEKSVAEVMKILYEKKFLTKIQYERLKTGYGFPCEDKDKLLRLYQRSSRIQNVLDNWLTNKEDHKSCKGYLKDLGINRVVVYGCGVLGRHLIKELESIDVNIEYIMDKDSSRAIDGIRTIQIGEKISSDSAIILTPVLEQEEIQNELNKYYDNQIISINYLIDNMQ